MKTYNVTLDVTEIVGEELKDQHDQMVGDVKNRKKGKFSVGFFDNDKDTDIKIMEEHIAAFKLLMKYYGVSK